MHIDDVVKATPKRKLVVIDLRYGSNLTRMMESASVVTFRTFERILESSPGLQGHDVALGLARDIRVLRWPNVSDDEYASICERIDPFIEKTHFSHRDLNSKEQRTYARLRNQIDRNYGLPEL